VTPDKQSLLDRRAALLGPNVATFYDDPVHLVRGQGTRVWDAQGREYLDCYNNVPHVGHCHPKVVQAICAQAATLNTHTRYLHDGILDYAEALTATFAASLDTAIMVCTGSEANDIALRMAQAVTGNTGIIATDHTYHGNTALVAQLGAKRAQIGERRDDIAFVPAPDSYRPPGGVAGAAHAQAFAAAIEARIADLAERGHGLSALIVCPYFANEGFPDLAPGWLDPAIAAVSGATSAPASPPISSPWASRWAMVIRSRRWSPARRSWPPSATGWAISTLSAATRWRRRRRPPCWT
jgi:4-aminobutyrate aminotransferase-like enzyme